MNKIILLICIILLTTTISFAQVEETLTNATPFTHVCLESSLPKSIALIVTSGTCRFVITEGEENIQTFDESFTQDTKITNRDRFENIIVDWSGGVCGAVLRCY